MTGDKMQQEPDMESEMVQKDGRISQKDGRGNPKDGHNGENRWNIKKKRGPNRRTITLGGLNKIEKAKKRKEKQRLRRKLGEMGVPDGRKKRRPQGPLPPTRSVLFVDNTAGGELASRFQMAEEEAVELSGYRVRITESAGTALSMLLPSTNTWGTQYCMRLDCVTCHQRDERVLDCRK